MWTTVHPDGHGSAGFPAAQHPRVDLPRQRIVLAPDLETEGPGCDVPLGLKPADALGHRDGGLRKTQGLGAAGIVEGKTRPVVGVGTGAALQVVFVLLGSPGSRQIDLRQRGESHAQQYRQTKDCFIAGHVSSPVLYHLAEHSEGFHPVSSASFLKCELMMKGSRRYVGSVTTMVTTISTSPLRSFTRS